MAYIYRHIRLDKNEPFYIGIGSDDKGKYNISSNLSKRNKTAEGFIWKYKN
jgi:hypothetical protein